MCAPVPTLVCEGVDGGSALLTPEAALQRESSIVDFLSSQERDEARSSTFFTAETTERQH